MSRPFKNALCLDFMPDAYGFSHGAWAMSCHRRSGHKGRHRLKFKDGGVREWSSGDKESALLNPAQARRGRR